MSYIDPNEFVITRKRKKYKFAKFANSDLCYEFDDWTTSAVDVIEVGAGDAMFSAQLAERHPDVTFVAVDVKADRLQKGAYRAHEKGLTNIRFLRARADQLTDCFASGSIRQIWLTFPDPYPKKRSAGRRMTHPTFLKMYAQLLRDDGTFTLKHDNPSFFAWSLEQLVAERWNLHQLTFDLHDSTFGDDDKLTTSYEERWLSEGRTTQLVRASYVNS